jgi:hypothetical protein
MSKTIQLTYEDKILLYLLKFVGMEERYQVSKDVCQEAIAQTIDIQRKHLPRTLRKMIKKEEIVEKRAHVIGVKQIRRVYFLTWKGEVLAQKLKEELENTDIKFKRNGKEIATTLGEVENILGIRYSFLEIVCCVNNKGVLSLKNLIKERDKRTKRQEKPSKELIEKKLEIYRKALEKAWIDGQITLNERIILDNLRDELGIESHEHEKLERETISKIPLIHQERLDIYKFTLAVALRNLEISEDEKSMLEALREKLQITLLEHEEMKREILRDPELIENFKDR